MQQLTEHDYLQIENGAQCGVSGTLAEWPHLAAALKKLGCVMPLTTPGLYVRKFCEGFVAYQKYMEFIVSFEPSTAPPGASAGPESGHKPEPPQET